MISNLNKSNNVSLISCRQQSTFNFQHAFISRLISDMCNISSQTKETGYIFPLYLYPETTTQQSIEPTPERIPNLNIEIVKQIAEQLGLTFVTEKNSPPMEGCPKGGVFHSPPMEGCPKGGVANSPKEAIPTGEVILSPPFQTVTIINNIPIKRNFIEDLPFNPFLKQRAKDKRKAGILSEVLFWQQVHKGCFHNIDFDRQRIIGNFIVDFYVKTLGLVIEIDGSSHDDKEEYDAKRQAFLENLGIKVYRIADIDVKKDLGRVMYDLECYIISEYGGSATLVFDHPSTGGEFAPIDILDYIYAVLHSPTYREKYKEFLKIDFPRVPYPKDKETFWALVKLGGELRQIHLLESPTVDKLITTYPQGGTNTVDKIKYEEGKVWINNEQYFDHVPPVAWEFYIGGYQPAQKWLKDRKCRTLSFDDILHYQKIIVALTETDRLMKEIEKIEIE